MDALIQDVQQAMRSLRRSIGFAATSACIVALGVGTATAGFTMLNWVLLRPLPGVRNPHELGVVWFAARDPHGGFNPNGLTSAQLVSVKTASSGVEQLGPFESPLPVYVTVGSGTPQKLNGQFVAPTFLTALGTRVELGRLLAQDDDERGAGQPVAVASDAFWRETLGARSDVIGSEIRVNGFPITIVGVAEPGFRGIDRMTPTDLWMPGGIDGDVQHWASERPAELTYFHDVVRLRKGTTFESAERSLAAAVRRVAAGDTANFYATVTATMFPGLGLPVLGREYLRHELWIVMAIAALMLGAACANVANLFLLHRARRRPEAVIRMVLGASRTRLVRYYLTESALIGIAGAAAGILGAAWLLDVLRGLPLVRFVSLDGMVPDWRVFAFAAVAGVTSAVVAGIIPALTGSRPEFGADIRNSGPTATRAEPLLRGTLAMLQMAIAIAAVAGAGLMARTLYNFNAVPLGFEPSGVSVFAPQPDQQGYTPEKAASYRRQLRARVQALPGVAQVALASQPPMTGVSFTTRVTAPGAPADAPPLMVTEDQVSSGYFATLGIPLIEGVGFDASDDIEGPIEGTKVIVSLGLAEQLFGTAVATGDMLKVDGKLLQVVGVVGDTHWGERAGPMSPILYRSLGGELPFAPMLVVKSTLSPETVVKEVTRASAELDPLLPIQSRGPLATDVNKSLGDRSLLFRLLEVLSLLTLALAAIGLYSLVAYGVATRTREFGIRLALGAGASDIVRAAAASASFVVVAGLTTGILATLYLTRFIGSQLYGVSRLDPLAIGGAALVLAAAAFLASWIPARRATKVDPMIALRAE